MKMNWIVFLSCFYFVFGQLPCSNMTVIDTDVVSCGGIIPIVIGPQTRICNVAVSTGNSVYFAFDLADNSLLNDLQFGISVQAKNATSLDPANFISVYVLKDFCPSSYCPKAQNAFQIACGYDAYITSSSITSLSSPLKAQYRNALDGIYYIQVLGPTQGVGGSTIIFDIEINDGDKVLARFVSVIAVPLFCFVFAVVIIFIFFWKKTHGGWKEDSVELPKEIIIVPNKPRGISTRNLLQHSESTNSVGMGNNSAMVGTSLDSMVTLFREQTAALKSFSEVNLMESKSQNQFEMREDVRDVDVKRTFVPPVEESSSSASEGEKRE